MGLFDRLLGGSDAEKRKQQILAHEARQASEESRERKARSIAFLNGKGVATIAHLPVIEDEKTAKFRSQRAIAERLVACTIAAVAGESGDAAFIRGIVKDLAAESLLSPKEREFIARDLGNQQQRTQFGWRYERAWVLLWSLGYVDRLDYPTAICDVPRLAGFVRDNSVEQIVAKAKPRSKTELLDAADLIYRLDWAVVDERANGTKRVPMEVERGVVFERHAALNWLIGYLGQEWDDITTDT